MVKEKYNCCHAGFLTLLILISRVWFPPVSPDPTYSRDRHLEALTTMSLGEAFGTHSTPDPIARYTFMTQDGLGISFFSPYFVINLLA